MGKIDWSSLWKKEDWWACWLGWFIILLAILKATPPLPKIAKWAVLAKAFPAGLATIWTTIDIFLFLLVLTLIGVYFMKKKDLALYPLGFIVIFLLSFLALFLAKNKIIHYWGIEYVLWALFAGLAISNTVGVPRWLKPAVMTEYFIKIGLVLLGAEISFWVIVKAGAVGMGQALLVVVGVWFFAYWLCRRFGINERFSSVIATGVSICGVSAAIAAGGAVQGDPKEVSYIVAWLMICAVVLIIVMPPLAKMMHLPTNMAGAWVGGVIDNTGAVIAAGEVVGTKAALDTAALVKMAQNVLIGFAAFLLAIWATFQLERKPGVPRPSLMEVWYRFPKFIVGFVVGSLIATFIVVPLFGPAGYKAFSEIMGGFRSYFFSLCFVSIGLETRVSDLIKVGGGKPAIAYWLAQIFNIFWTLGIVYLLWSGRFFTPPILPD